MEEIARKMRGENETLRNIWRGEKRQHEIWFLVTLVKAPLALSRITFSSCPQRLQIALASLIVHLFVKQLDRGSKTHTV